MPSEPNHPQGDSDFVALLTEIQLPLQLYVRTLLPGDSGAKDVAQQVNAAVWRKRDEFTLGTNFKAWVFAVARFEVLSYRKKQARDSRLVFSDELEQTISDEMTDSTPALEEQFEALNHCLHQLRTSDRELIMHRYASKGTLSDFAETSGRSIGGLKVTLHRLRTALLACIERQLAAEVHAS